MQIDTAKFVADKQKKPQTKRLRLRKHSGRGRRIRTLGTRFWRPLLYQLSYTPMSLAEFPTGERPFWWAFGDSNPGPAGYEPAALTN